MNNKTKKILIPDSLISNQNNEIGISPKTTYLYVWIKVLITDYKTNTLLIQPVKLREKTRWKTNAMLKTHLKVLKDLGYISYQDEFDNNVLKANQFLEIIVPKIKTNFKELNAGIVEEKILSVDNLPEQTLRFCLLLKYYTNKNYGYCWLTYDQIEKWGQIRRRNIDEIINNLLNNQLIHVTKGGIIKDSTERIRKSNNKYQLLFY